MEKFLRYSFTYMGNRPTNFHICMTATLIFWRSANSGYESFRKKGLKITKIRNKKSPLR